MCPMLDDLLPQLKRIDFTVGSMHNSPSWRHKEV